MEKMPKGMKFFIKNKRGRPTLFKITFYISYEMTFHFQDGRSN